MALKKPLFMANQAHPIQSVLATPKKSSMTNQEESMGRSQRVQQQSGCRMTPRKSSIFLYLYMIQSTKIRKKLDKPQIIKQKRPYVLHKNKPHNSRISLKTQPKQPGSGLGSKLQQHSFAHLMVIESRPRTSLNGCGQQQKKIKIDQRLQKIDLKLHQIKSKIDSGLSRPTRQNRFQPFKIKTTPKIKIDPLEILLRRASRKMASPGKAAVKPQIYYVSGVVKTFLQDYDLPQFKEHINFTLNILQKIKTIKKPPDKLLLSKQLNLSRRSEHFGRKTIIFDLDQTLVHCISDPLSPSHFKLKIQSPQDKEFAYVGINVRPYAIECLKRLSAKFQLMLFTASFSYYAEKVLQIIDPHKTIFAHRLFRQHCYLSDGVLIKDLRIINRQLSQMVLVDNAAYSYFFQPENGVPIIPYLQGEQDRELESLGLFCEQYLECEDVRDVNRRFFKLERYRSFDNGEELAYRLYGEWDE